jgi:ATP-dependent helicase/nuclease subunit A
MAATEAKLSASEVGTAHHEFLRIISLDQIEGVDSLQAQAQRLLKQGRLTTAQVAVLDFEGLAGFWNSELGRQILANQSLVHRELPFTARFSPTEFRHVSSQPGNGDNGNEFVLVQGVADLVVIAPDEIRLVDFKTDQLTVEEVEQRVKIYEPQLRLYALALSRIYRRPVCEAWLYLVGLRRAVSVECPSLQPCG